MCQKSLNDLALLFFILVEAKISQVVVTYSDDVQLIVMSIPNFTDFFSRSCMHLRCFYFLRLILMADQ
ncbi:hypothetical protein VspSTUT11_31670 [Vibrio sp. STUT-A11]|nr:hypothetical protein VspSTUT11_31670 [Vibrio sp. STUT-A11]